MSTPDVHHRQIDIRGFSAGSYVGAAVALIASRFSQSFRLHVTLGGIAATLVHLCGLAALKCDTAPQHHVRLVHFLTDKLCGWRPTPLAKWLMQHIHYILVESAVDWMSSNIAVDISSKWTSQKARGSSCTCGRNADFRPQHVRWRLPLRLASWMQSIGSKLDLGFVLDLLHLDG